MTFSYFGPSDTQVATLPGDADIYYERVSELHPAHKHDTILEAAAHFFDV